VPDPETFLTELYVLADGFCKTALPPERRPGPPAALARGEVVTLAVYGQWARFRSERDFYRYAAKHLRGAFPGLPARPQLNRLLRRHRGAVEGFARWLAAALGAHAAPYEALDGTGGPTRTARRRGRGWLPGLADVGMSTRLGWYEGLRLLVAADPAGVVTGFGFGPASADDRALAETLFALRAAPDPRLPTAGRAASGVYAADTGFAGQECEARWVAACGAQVVAPPQPDAARAWPARERRRFAALRQVVETVFDRLHAAFRLDRERPHDLSGFQARLAAEGALHNFCVWLNRKLGQPDLALADLLGW
jgi:Transposase DDE domain